MSFISRVLGEQRCQVRVIEDRTGQPSKKMETNCDDMLKYLNKMDQGCYGGEVTYRKDDGTLKTRKIATCDPKFAYVSISMTKASVPEYDCDDWGNCYPKS